jgi:hypothetical protein
MGSHPGCVCPLLSRLGTLGTLLARSSHSPSSFLPPFPRCGLCCPPLSAAGCGLGTMKALTPTGLTQAAGSLRLLRLAVPTFRPQPRDPLPGRFVRRLSARGCSRLRRPRGGSPRTPAETGSSSYGLPVHLRLLSTPRCRDAVTFNFWAATNPGTDFHRADKASSRTHSWPAKADYPRICLNRHRKSCMVGLCRPQRGGVSA